MKITRHNYEEYFILYLDNELEIEDRRQVELFVQENPDLKAELDLLLQSQLTPDTTLVFSNKEQLIRQADAHNTINTANYEEWLLLYTDNELAAEERMTVEQFANSYPAIKRELEILQKTKLQPETIAFPNKQSLYHKEEKVRVIGIHWKRIAIAAAFLLAVSSTALIIFNENDKKPGIALGEPAEIKENMPGKSIVKPAAEEQDANLNSLPLKKDQATKENTSTDNIIITVKEKKTERKESLKQLPVEITPAEAILVKAKKEEKHTNDLPEPIYSPNVNKTVDQNILAKVETPAGGSLTNSKETNSSSTVTPNNPRPLDNVITASLIDDEPVKKNKLRGFFRKVTRTFEKTTNIKATDDDDRLLVGGLAIKL